MEKKRSLAYNYAFEALPILFHGQTDGFIKYIEKDGVEFLKFWWNHVGDQLEKNKRLSPAGLSFDIESFDSKTKIVFITFPTAQEDGDPILVACVARPERRFAWVRLQNTEYFILSRYDGSKADNKTAFGVITPRGIYHENGIGLAPLKQDFKRIVKARLEKKKSEKKK
ncbi:MAG: hypothetical protein Q7U31_09190 [Anaerolineaceae bacterium]|nr:hypothetical protein [Anaerolineaceae bacterium]